MICPDLVPDQRGGAADGATLIGRGLRYGRFIVTDILVNTTDSLASVAQTNNWSRNPGQKRRKSPGLESSCSRVAAHAAFWLKSEHSGSGSMYRVEYASFPDPALHYEYKRVIRKHNCSKLSPPVMSITALRRGDYAITA